MNRNESEWPTTGGHDQGPAAQLEAVRRVASEAVQGLQDLTGVRSIDWTEVTRELVQLRPVLSQLIALAAEDQTAPAEQQETSLGPVLRQTRERLLPLIRATGRDIKLELLRSVCTSPVDEELHEAIHSLLETSLSMGTGPVLVRERIEQESGEDCLLTEVLNDELDVPDRVRRKLSKAVSAHAGQTSFVTARSGSCVRFRLPIARRAATVVPA